MAAPFYRRHAIAIFVVLGAVSGVLSHFTSPYAHIPALVRGFPPFGTISLAPGLVFAVALAIGISLTATRRVAPIAAMMAASIFGWWIVIEIAVHPVFFNHGRWLNFVHWINCGLIGALIVGGTGAFAGLYDRSFRNLAEIAFVGALTGPLVLAHAPYHWPVYIGWQTLVAAAIGHAIVRSKLAAPAAASASTTPA